MLRAAILGCAAALAVVGCGEGEGGPDDPQRSQPGPNARELARLDLTRDRPEGVRDACALAARESSLEVHCPPIVPAGEVADVQYAGTRDRHTPDSYVLHMISPSMDYPGSQRSGGLGGHWVVEVWAGGGLGYLRDADGKRDPIRSRRLELAGKSVEALWMRSYNDGGGAHGSHVAIRWRQRGIEYVVSIHGHRHLEQVEAMAEAMIRQVGAAG